MQPQRKAIVIRALSKCVPKGSVPNFARWQTVYFVRAISVEAGQERH